MQRISGHNQIGGGLPKWIVSRTANFTQGTPRRTGVSGYTSPDDCNHHNVATLPDDLLGIIRVWSMLSTQVKDCIHALATATIKDM